MAKRLERIERKERHRIRIRNGIPIPEPGIQRDARTHRKDAQDYIKLDADLEASKPETIANNHPGERDAVHAKQKATLRMKKENTEEIEFVTPNHLLTSYDLKTCPNYALPVGKQTNTDTKQNGHSAIFETYKKRLLKGMGVNLS